MRRERISAYKLFANYRIARPGFLGNRNLDFNRDAKRQRQTLKEGYSDFLEGERERGESAGEGRRCGSDKFYETNFMRWRYAKV